MSDRGTVDGRVGRPRGYHGHYREEYPESQTLRAIAAIDETWVSAVDVADQMGCHHETARLKCNSLVEEGRLRSKKPRPRRKFYALPSDVEGESQD